MIAVPYSVHQWFDNVCNKSPEEQKDRLIHDNVTSSRVSVLFLINERMSDSAKKNWSNYKAWRI